MLATHPMKTQKKTPTTRQHMKFKDCDVKGNKIVFVHPQDLQKYSNDLIGLSTFLDGNITVEPNLQRDCQDYHVMWATDGCLPVSFDKDHLHTKFNESNKEYYQILRFAQIAYDKEYPDAKGKGPLHLCLKMSGTPCTDATVLDTQNNTDGTQTSVEHVLTTARMMP